MRRFWITAAVASVLLGSSGLHAKAQQVGFLEKFALAEDRTKVLQELIPGSEDYFYYHCLHYQNAGQLAEAEAILQQWSASITNHTNFQQMFTRQRLLRYTNQPQEALDYLRNNLGLQLDHAPPQADRAKDLSTSLDPKTLDQNRLIDENIAADPGLSNITDRGLLTLLDRNLSIDQVRVVLQRVTRVDIPGLMKLIETEFRTVDSRGWGAFPIYSQLTLEQRKQLIKTFPNLLENDNFVRQYLIRLLPNDDISVDDQVERKAHLQRLEDFTSQLPPSQNSLKANVLYQRLLLDANAESFDRARFEKYLALPRNQGYYSQDYLKAELRTPLVEFQANYLQETRLPPIGNDTALLRRYLEHFFQSDDKIDRFSKWLDRGYLESVLIETKILYVLGPSGPWYAKLSPQQQKDLRDRVELRFAGSSKTHYLPSDDVRLTVDVKNVPKLIVRIYQLNPQNIYRKQRQGVSTDIDLDGLVANAEQTIEYSIPADRRHRENIDLPQCAGRGAWVIDLLGGGLRSRALVVKGQLRSTQTLTDAGHELRIFDESGKPVPTASIELGNRTYTADEDGVIAIPYGEQDVALPILLVDGPAATVEIFKHRKESYRLEMGVLMDSQNLLSGAKGSLIIRPQLLCNGQPVSIQSLEEPTLTIVTTDQDGTQSTLSVPGFELRDDAEATHQFLVPQRLRNVTVTLNGKVQSLSRRVKESVAAAQAIQVNDVATTSQVSDYYLTQDDRGYRLQVRGRNGEPIARLPLTLQLWLDHIVQPQSVTLATDANGEVQLGKLEMVHTMQASAAGMSARSFSMRRDVLQWPSQLAIEAGKSIELPWGIEELGTDDGASDWTLLESRSGNIVAELNKKVRVRDGRLVLEALEAGLYYLTSHRVGGVIEIRATRGVVRDEFIVGPSQSIERNLGTAASIVAKEIKDGKLRLKIGGADRSTRVHLVGSAFVEDAGLTALLRLSLSGQFRQPYQASPSFYVDSLKLDEEYQYILQRQYATKYAGNLLAQPSLLLNPWDTASTANSRQEAASGDMPPPSAAEPMSAADPFDVNELAKQQAAGLGRSFYEFLANSAIFLANRRPDESGWIELPIDGLNGVQSLSVMVVDRSGVSSQIVPLPIAKIPTTDLRLARSFEAEKHLSQQQRVRIIEANTKVDLGDARSTKLQTYSSISDVYRLYSTLLPSPELEKFRVMLQWGQLKEEEKQRVYSELACHELHMFLYVKDRAFFDKVVAPYLDDKYASQIIDDYLLDRDLSQYRDLWQRGRLNSLERVLLAQRIPEAKNGIGKWMIDAVEARKIPPELRSQRFLAAMAGASLDLSRSLVESVALGDVEARFYADNGAIGNRLGGALAEDAKQDFFSKNEPVIAGMTAEEALSRPSRDGAKEMDEYALSELEDLAFDAPASGGMGGGGMGGMGGMPGAESKDKLSARKLGRMRGAMAGKPLFVQLDATREWAEMQYYRFRIQQQGLGLIPPGPLWQDFSRHGSLEKFLSSEFHLSSNTLTEVLCILALLDLPYESQKVQIGVEEGRLVLTSPSRCVVFVESIEETKKNEQAPNILVGQDFYLVNPGSDVDPQKPVTGQALVKGTGYRANVVVTNPSSIPQTTSVLTQLPQGAIPLEGGKVVTSRTLRLEPYSTQQVQYTFYFPKAGDFTHYGAQVSIEDLNATSIASNKLRVLDEPESQDKNTWNYVALWGTNEQVLEFLKTKNTQQLQLDLIAFRMQDKSFFDACLVELESQGIFHPVLWAYAVRHNDAKRISQFLSHRDDVTARFGPLLDSPIAQFDSADRYDYEHLDYRPLVNARSHLLGAQRVILNDRLAGQYQRLLQRMAFQPKLIDRDRMALTYYLLVQNRIEEALQNFDRVAVERLPNRIQYDYFDAYLDFYREKYEHAAEIAGRYVDYGVTRWRDLFAQVRLQVRQRQAMVDGTKIPDVDVHASDVTDPIQRMLLDVRSSQQANLAADTPSIDLTMKDGKLVLNHQRLEKVEVRFYLMDIELLFSRNPFVQQDGKALMSIQPNRVEVLALSTDKGKREIELPKELANRNVMVEVTAGALSQSQVVYANSMDVTLVDAYGRLQVVAEGGKPVDKVYVKVYARHRSGEVKFFKDGYSDLRGQFDYASLSTNDLDTVERFSILILHPDRGAMIREVAPPKR